LVDSLIWTNPIEYLGNVRTAIFTYGVPLFGYITSYSYPEIWFNAVSNPMRDKGVPFTYFTWFDLNSPRVVALFFWCICFTMVIKNIGFAVICDGFTIRFAIYSRNENSLSLYLVRNLGVLHAKAQNMFIKLSDPHIHAVVDTGAGECCYRPA
jgi:hypothetical protein